MNTKQTALDAYLARTAAIHAKLERLQRLADNASMPGTAPVLARQAEKSPTDKG